MQIEISGLIPEARKAEILKIAKEAAKKFKISRNQVKVSIAMSLYGLDHGIVSQLSPKHYQVWLNKALTAAETRKAIGHEFWHVRQFLAGDLIVKNNTLYFKNELMSGIPYLKRPFEIEARTAEREF